MATKTGLCIVSYKAKGNPREICNQVIMSDNESIVIDRPKSSPVCGTRAWLTLGRFGLQVRAEQPKRERLRV